MVSTVHLNDLRNDIACDSGKLLLCPFYVWFINLFQFVKVIAEVLIVICSFSGGIK